MSTRTRTLVAYSTDNFEDCLTIPLRLWRGLRLGFAKPTTPCSGQIETTIVSRNSWLSSGGQFSGRVKLR